MYSVMPSEQSVCPRCGTYTSPEARACDGCGAKQDVRPDGRPFGSNMHFVVGLCFIVVGAGGFLGYYPPGSTYYVEEYRLTSTASDVVIYGGLPLTIGALYLLSIVVFRVKEKFFR